MLDKHTILAVDDDKATQTIVKDFLEEEGYKVITCAHGKQMTKLLESTQPDLILLDILLPDKDGLPLIQSIKNITPTPVIVISDKSSVIDKVVGLEMGADDYLGKPLQLHELAARIKANLRLIEMVEENIIEENKREKAAEIIQFKDWYMDRKAMKVTDRDEKVAQLTTGEFKLLEALVLAAGQVLSREKLFEITRQGQLDAYDRAIDIQLGRIRKKLNDDPKHPKYIKTVRGVGYMFVAETKSKK